MPAEKKYYGLLDCNNFYASCERAFRPDLRNVPIAVLSNNDGCIVARSAEVKALGIPNGAPLFKYQNEIKKHGIKIFSSNYALYGDLSNRIMNCIERVVPEVEVYSIDEAFMAWKGFRPEQIAEQSKQLRADVLQWTSIPTSIGVSHTKALAKVANKIAKKTSKDGVYVLIDENDIREQLKKFAVGDLWGIGHRSAAKLARYGITTAEQFRNAPSKLIRKELTVTGLRVAEELRGIPCIVMEEAPPAKQCIASTRSFGKLVEDISLISEAVSTYTNRAVEKLRGQNSLASAITVFLRTNRFSELPQYGNSSTKILATATDFLPDLATAAQVALQEIYKAGYKYHKAGVMLHGISSKQVRQANLFSKSDIYAQDSVMEAFDKVNNRFGKHTLKLASQGTALEWQMRANLRSPEYTTRWEELPTANLEL